MEGGRGGRQRMDEVRGGEDGRGGGLAEVGEENMVRDGEGLREEVGEDGSGV